MSTLCVFVSSLLFLSPGAALFSFFPPRISPFASFVIYTTISHSFRADLSPLPLPLGRVPSSFFRICPTRSVFMLFPVFPLMLSYPISCIGQVPLSTFLFPLLSHVSAFPPPGHMRRFCPIPCPPYPSIFCNTPATNLFT